MKRARIVATQRNGALRIDIREYADGRFGFDWQRDGYDRKQIRCNEQAEAERRAMELLGATKAGTVDLLKIDPEEYAAFLSWRAERTRDGAIPALVESFLKAKEAEGLSIWTMRDLRQLREFAAAFPGVIGDVRGEDVRDWLNTQDVGPRRWNNLLAVIKGLFRYARDNDYLGERKTSVEKIPKRRRASADVETYTPDELRQLLRVVDREWLPTIILGAFAGIRPQEIAPDPRDQKPGLAWENVMWEKRKIDVPKAVAKDRRRRFVPLCDAAAAFLADWRHATGRIAPQGVRFSNLSRQWVATLNESAPWKWKDDGLRHSYASYRLAEIHDVQRLSLEMGNSVRICHDHYLDLKHEDEAAEWFGMRPEASEAGKIIELKVS